MSNYATLKAAIQAAVYTNGSGDITGAGLQTVLLQIVNTVGGGYTFAGVATPGTSPGTPDENVFYIAPAGTYANFGNSISVGFGELGVFMYNGSWTKTVVQIGGSGSGFNPSEDGTQFASLSDVIALLPASMQKAGATVRFLDTDNKWHTYYCANDTFSSSAYKWREKDKTWNHDGTVNAPNVDLMQCYTYTDNKNVLYGNKDYVDKVNYIKLRIRNNGTYRFLGIFKVNTSTNVVTQIRNVDVLDKYTNGEIAEIPLPLITCGANEYIALDGSCWYAGAGVSGSQNETTRFAINKDGTGYSEAAGTPMGFVVGYKSDYACQLIETSDWSDSSFSIANSSAYPDIWSNREHVDNAVGIKLKINRSESLSVCSVWKFDYYGTAREKICDIDVTQYTDKSIVDIYFGKTVYFAPTEYMGISSPFYFSAVNALIKFTRTRKYADGSIDDANNMFIGYMPITIEGLTIPASMLPLQGKRISVLGDSISAFSGIFAVSNPYYPASLVTSKERMWYYQLEQRAGATVNWVDAIGACLVKGSDTNQTPCSAPSRYDALYSEGATGEAPDVIFVFAGVNDWNGSTALGDYTDDWTGAYNTLTKFVPSYRSMLAGIEAEYPSAQVYCVTPYRTFYNATDKYPPTKGGHTLTEYVEAIKGCASLHGAKVIDLYDGISINEANVSSILADTLHPSLHGQSLIATEIMKQI